MINNDLSNFFNSLEVQPSFAKPSRQYVVVNADSGVTTIQFIRPTKDIFNPRFYVKCAIADEYSNKLNNICYDPKDKTNPLVQIVDRFKKVKFLSNSNNPSQAQQIQQAKSFMQNATDLVNLVLGSGAVNNYGFKDVGFCGTEYFTGNIAMFDNSMNPIKTGVFSRGSKEVNGDHGKFTIHSLGVSWYTLYQAFKKRNIDLFKDFNALYNYAITIKMNNPNFSDPNWFENNSMLEILALNNPVNTMGYEEYDISKAIKYTSYDTIANKLGYVFKNIDNALKTNFNDLLREKVIAEHNGGVSLNSNTNNINSNSNIPNSNNSVTQDVMNYNNNNSIPNVSYNTSVNSIPNQPSNQYNQFVNQVPNATYNNSNSNFNSNMNTQNNNFSNIPNANANINNSSVFTNNSISQVQQSQIPNSNISNIQNTNTQQNVLQQAQPQSQVTPNIPNIQNTQIQNTQNASVPSSSDSVSFDDLFN